MQPELSERAAFVADCAIVSPMHAQNLREKRSDVYVHWAAAMIDCLVYVNKAQLLVLLSKALSHSDASASTISKAWKCLWCSASSVHLLPSGNKRCTVAAWIICSF